MKKAIIAGLLVFFLIQVFFLNIAYAQSEPVDISELPQRFADALGIPLLAGQILTSILSLVLFLLPVLLYTKGRQSQTWIILILGFSIMCLDCVLGWLPYWIPLLLALIVAGTWSAKIKGWIA